MHDRRVDVASVMVMLGLPAVLAVMGALMWFAPAFITLHTADASFVCNGIDEIGAWYDHLSVEAYGDGFTESLSSALHVDVLTQHVTCTMSRDGRTRDYIAGPLLFAKVGAGVAIISAVWFARAAALLSRGRS